jgi:hypothetical protein
MNSTRKIAVITGVIFILAAVLVFVADALTPGLPGTDSLTRFSAHTNQVTAGVFAFCLGAFMYYYLFFQSRLIPRWLSGFGIVAIILMMAACVLALFSGNRITSYIPLAFPIFLQEMVLAVWLIVKGFNPSAVASLPAKTAPNELLRAV